MANDEYQLFACELCGGKEFAEILEARIYTADQPVHVCKNCGFVQVIRRRSPERIARVWAEELFKTNYTAGIPAVKARQVYVAETIKTNIGLSDKNICDIGAGEGDFLTMLRDDYNANVFGIEPSSENCSRMRDADIACFDGTAEQFANSQSERKQFDIVTMIWTLENSNSCRRLMSIAWDLLREGGHVVVATGSRILVPFKKPLDRYFGGANAADTHAFRFSANTLEGLFAETSFSKTFENQYIDSDVLCMIGARADRDHSILWPHDDWQKVTEYFARWHADTAFYKAR